MRGLLVRAGLRFEDARDEASFLERYVLRHRLVTQLLALACGLLQYSYALIDRLTDPSSADVSHAIRALTFVFIAGMAALLGLPVLRRRMEVLMVVTLAAVAGSMVLIVTVLDRDIGLWGVAFVLMVVIASNLFTMRIGYFAASGVCILAAAGGALALVPPGETALANAISVVAAVAIGVVAVTRREQVARREWLLMRQVEVAHGRIEDLLDTMLPHEVAQRIQGGETAIADTHEEAAIVFADLVGFTELSRRIGAEDLVELLNRTFSAFDRLADRYGVERIKTIGDCYMAVSGLSRRGGDPLGAAADFALELPAVVTEISGACGHPLQVRVGLHLGPVVAGVIGVQRPAFDCWGETVNLASRLETAGAPGIILVSEAVHARLKSAYLVTPLEPLDLKGFGRTPVYRLERGQASR